MAAVITAVILSESEVSRVQLCDPMDWSSPGSSVHGIFPGKNTGLGCCFLLLLLYSFWDWLDNERLGAESSWEFEAMEGMCVRVCMWMRHIGELDTCSSALLFVQVNCSGQAGLCWYIFLLSQIDSML